MPSYLQIENLTKSFGSLVLYENVDFELSEGQKVAIVAKNGAGKSTTIKLILNMLRRDSGTVTILGRDNTEDMTLTKEEIGVVFDEVGIPDCLSAVQFGKVMRGCYSGWDDAEYRKYIEKDAALERRFQPVLVAEPTVEDTISILRGLKERYEVYPHLRRNGRPYQPRAGRCRKTA